MKLLHIDSSALGEHSVSRELTAHTVERLRREHPGLEVVYRDLAAAPLAHWSPAGDTDGAQALEEFLAADIVVLGAPMYNFAVPSQLKAWIDRILVAGTTFRYTAEGPQGLVAGKRIVVVSSRGGFYGQAPMTAMDFQEPYLRTVFGFIGLGDIEFVRAEGIAVGPEQKAQALDAARGQIDGLLARAA